MSVIPILIFILGMATGSAVVYWIYKREFNTHESPPEVEAVNKTISEADGTRQSGRSTRAAIRYILVTLENPGTEVELRDHHTGNRRSANYFEMQVRSIIRHIGLNGVSIYTTKDQSRSFISFMKFSGDISRKPT